METIFGVHQETTSLHEKNLRLRRNRSQEHLSSAANNTMTSQITRSEHSGGSTTATTLSPVDLRNSPYGLHSIWSGRLLSSPAISPHASPSNSRPVTPSEGSGEAGDGGASTRLYKPTSVRPFGPSIYNMDYNSQHPQQSKQERRNLDLPPSRSFGYPLTRSISHDPALFQKNMKRVLPNVSAIEGDELLNTTNRSLSPWNLYHSNGEEPVNKSSNSSSSS